MRLLEKIGKKKLVLGMVHLLPLPGTPYFTEGNLEASYGKALHDAKALYEGGADGCVIQTIDKVYPIGEEVDYARLAAVTNITHEVVNSLPKDFYVGVQILFNALTASLAVAFTSGGAFIRSAVFVGATNTEMGVAQADPEGFLGYRKKIGAKSIAVSAEIHGLHYKDVRNQPLSTLAGKAKQFGADIVEVASQDENENELLVMEIKDNYSDLPVFLGGYTDQQNIAKRIRYADGVFAASCFQPAGWGSNIDKNLVKEYVQNITKNS